MSASQVSLFIDFENFVYGARQKGMEPPSLASLMELVSKWGRIKDARAFGPYELLNEYRQDLRATSIDANLAESPGSANKCNTADFFMLDSLYRSAVGDEELNCFAIVTGDAAFAGALGFLRHRLKKTIVVMGYPWSTSQDVIKAATEFVSLEPVEPEDWPVEEQLELIRFIRKGELDGKLITLSSTARVYKPFNRSSAEVRGQLIRMLNAGVFYQQVEEHGGQPVRRLYLASDHPLVQQAIGGSRGGQAV